MSEPKPYRSPFALRPAAPVDESDLPPWMRLRPGETERERSARVSHSCYVCGKYIVDPVALDAHEEGHSVSEQAASLKNRPKRAGGPVDHAGRPRSR